METVNHGTICVFTYILTHRNQLNVGEYIIHGSLV